MHDLQIEKLPEFDNHKSVNFVFDESSGLRGFIAIHRGGNKYPALGATRLWNYKEETDALRDALRLSRLMSYKSALAGLPYGGAKGVIIASPKALQSRKKLFSAYAAKVNNLDGRFVTGTDVGVEDKDVRLMRKITPHVIGNHVDPAHFTAVGVYHGIKEALLEKFHYPDISGHSFAIQGIGKTGSKTLALLYNDAAKIFIADIDAKKIKKIKSRFPKVKVVPPEVIHQQKVDVFVPCALSGVLNAKSVTELQCAIVAGSANNQLESDHIDALLYKLGILYAPDYAINAGGLISVVDEMEHGRPSKKRILVRVEGIRKMLQDIFKKSRKEKRPTNKIATVMAEKIFNGHH